MKHAGIAMAATLAMAAMAAMGGCERSSTTAAASKPVASSSVVEKTAGAEPTDTKGNDKRASDAIAAEIRASMTEFFTYSESVFAIVREHGKDCDAAAKALEGRAAVFQEMGPRMMQMRDKVMALSGEERARIEQEINEMGAAFEKKHPDMNELGARADECTKTSPAFADVSKRVMFKKKKS